MYYADADFRIGGVEDIGAVAGTVHKSLLSGGHAYIDGQILAGRTVGNAGAAHTVEGREALGVIVGKVTALDHVDSVIFREFRKGAI